MIWTWLKAVLIFFGKLIIPEPNRAIPKIDPNEVCPSCGHTNGQIRSYDDQGTPLVQHTCRVCMAKWYVKPVLNMKAPLISAQPAAKPLESAEWPTHNPR